MHAVWMRWLSIGVLGLATVNGAAAGDKKPEAAKAEGGALESVKPAFAITAELTTKDNRDKDAPDCYCKIYPFTMDKGETYQIDLKSKDFDAFLRLEDPRGKQVAEDDASGTDLDARILYKAAGSGEYRIVVTTFKKNETGKFTLTVRGGTDGARVAAAVQAKPIALKLEAGKPLQVDNQLTAGDAKEAHGKSYKLFTLPVQAGQLYRMVMKGNAPLDAYLRVEDEQGKLLHEDQFGGPNESGVEIVPHRTETVRIVATSYKPRMTGKFSLVVTQEKSAAAPKKPLIEAAPTPNKKVAPKAEPLNFAANKPVSVQGKLDADTPKDSQGRHFKAYSFPAQTGKIYRFELTSADTGFDPHLRIEAGNGQLLKNEDFADGKRSRVAFTPTQAGVLRIVASSYKPGTTGSFTLAASEADPKDAQVLKLPVFQKRMVAEVLGQLGGDDGSTSDGRLFKVYTFQAQPGKLYRIEMLGRSFDAKLHLEDAKGQKVKDEDSFEGRAALVVLPPGPGGTYRIVASSGTANQTGAFLLTVHEVESRPAGVGVALKFQEGRAIVQGALASTDAAFPGDKRYQEFTFAAAAGKVYKIDLHSKAFDSFLVLQEEAGKTIAKNDDADRETLDARIVFHAAKPGNYRIIVTSLEGGKTGPFTLTVVEAGMPKVTQLTLRKGQPAKVEGQLTAADGIDAEGKHATAYTFAAVQGEFYQFAMTGMGGLDPFLRIEDEAGKRLQDEDYGDGTRSHLAFKAPRDGTYRVVATTLKAGATGRFTLAAVPIATRAAKTEPLTLANKKAIIEGALTSEDGIDAKGKHFKVYTLPVEQGQSYRVKMTGKEGFNPFVRVDDSNGKTLKSEDWGDGKFSRLAFKAPAAGTYKIIASSYAPGVTGAYRLAIAHVDVRPAKAETLKLVKREAAVDATLTDKDGTDPQGKHFLVYMLPAEAGKTYRVEMTGKGELNPYVRIEDEAGKLVMAEQFGDGKLSRLEFKAKQAGPYKVVAMAFEPGMVGAFTLKVTQVEGGPASGQTQIPLVGDQAVAMGELDARDATLPGGKHFKEWTFAAAAGKAYRIDLHSKVFDAYLYLKDDAGKALAENDDAAPDTFDARIVYVAKQAGTVHVIVTSLQAGKVGPFTLRIAPATALDKVMARINDLPKATPAERKEAVQQLAKHLQSTGEKLTQQDADLATRVASNMELWDRPLASEAYANFGKVLAASSSEEVARGGKLLLGAAKRLNLLGEPMRVKGTTADGKPFDLAQQTGKVVLVDFWATWCAPCRAELPKLKKLYAKYHDQGFEVIGISLDNTKAELTRYLEKDKLPWSSIFEQANDIADDYGVFTIPLNILIGRDGRVLSLNARDEELERLLAEQFPPKGKN